MESAHDPRSTTLAALSDAVNAAITLRQALSDRLSLGPHETVTTFYLSRDGGADQTEIGRLLGITSSSVTALIDRLEQRGLAERAVDPSDRRRWRVQLTRSGRETAAEIGASGMHALDHIDDAEIPGLGVALGQMARNMEDQTALLTRRPPFRPTGV